MNKLSRYILAAMAAVTIAQSTSAQEVVWDAGFDFFFDNREYKSEINWPQTLFGARITPELGVRWDDRHTLMAGVDLLANFGDTPFDKGNEAFAYYQYLSEKFNAYAGVVPRRKLIGEYSPAFFSDSIKYYDPNLTGLVLQYSGRRGYFEFAADWNSMITDTEREKFILFSSGKLDFLPGRELYAGYNLSMYHHAGTYLEDGVVDNILAYPFAGVDLVAITGMEKLSFSVGWLQAFQNDRKYVGEYVKPGGVQLELHAQKWKFGIHNTFYKGDNLMPYWNGAPELDYGTGLYWGEPFYRTDDIYNRLELYWQPIHDDIMRLRVSSVHHYDGAKWGWQQKVVFSVALGQRKMFGGK